MYKVQRLNFFINLYKDTKDSIVIIDEKLEVYYLSQPAKIILPQLTITSNISDNYKGQLKDNEEIELFQYKAKVIQISNYNHEEYLYLLKINPQYMPVIKYFAIEEIEKSVISNLTEKLYQPLTLIYSSFELLRKNLPPDIDIKSKYSLSTIRQSFYRLFKIADLLSEISEAISNPKPDLSLQTIDVIRFVHETIVSLQEFSDIRNISIQLKSHCDQMLITADKKKLEKIILILLSNSFKYTRENNQINIIINETANFATICISDAGIGMDKQIIDEIFAPHKSENAVFNKPSGASLIVAKILIEQMGGTMVVESKKNVGTKITFTISKNLSNGLILGQLPFVPNPKDRFAQKYIQFCDIIDFNLLKDFPTL